MSRGHSQISNFNFILPHPFQKPSNPNLLPLMKPVLSLTILFLLFKMFCRLHVYNASPMQSLMSVPISTALAQTFAALPGLLLLLFFTSQLPQNLYQPSNLLHIFFYNNSEVILLLRSFLCEGKQLFFICSFCTGRTTCILLAHITNAFSLILTILLYGYINQTDTKIHDQGHIAHNGTLTGHATPTVLLPSHRQSPPYRLVLFSSHNSSSYKPLWSQTETHCPFLNHNLSARDAKLSTIHPSFNLVF